MALALQPDLRVLECVYIIRVLSEERVIESARPQILFDLIPAFLDFLLAHQHAHLFWLKLVR
jgi:hypothetical protein